MHPAILFGLSGTADGDGGISIPFDFFCMCATRRKWGGAALAGVLGGEVPTGNGKTSQLKKSARSCRKPDGWGTRQQPAWPLGERPLRPQWGGAWRGGRIRWPSGHSFSVRLRPFH